MAAKRTISREKIRSMLLLSGADWHGAGFEDFIDMITYSFRYHEISPDRQYAYLAKMAGVTPVAMKIRIRNQVKRIHRYQILRGRAVGSSPPSTADFVASICTQFDEGAREWVRQKSR
jgi:hypothetical protein